MTKASPDLAPNYWQSKSLDQMTDQEWESLCDGCGLCCLHKLQDEDTDEIAYTEVACRLLDSNTCRCKKYPTRLLLVPDCVVLAPELVDQFHWLPGTCAYRLVAEGKDLYPWHHLISGDPDSVHQAGISAKGRVISERDAGALEDHIIDWVIPE